MSDATRCLVLGGRGFIGSHLVDRLLELGYKVRCFDRPHVTELGGSKAQHRNFESYQGDFTSEADIESALVDCDICFHLISTTLPKTSNADPVYDVESNLVGSIKLLSHAKKAGVKKVVFVSSGGTVYGVPRDLPITEAHTTDPTCSYGITKLTIEKYLQLFYKLHGLDYVVLRLANPYGERQRIDATQGVMAVFLGKALRNESIEIWGDGSIVRDYLHIDDVVSALVASIGYQGQERVFNIGSGEGVSLNQALDIIERVTGKHLTRRYLESRLFDVPVNVLAIERAKSVLGWSPAVPLEEGIRRCWLWMNS